MTSNQHYIPQFYQKMWTCEQDGYMWRLDKQDGNCEIRKSPIRHSNSEEYLYEADPADPNNVVENCYGKFETRYSKPFHNLIKTMTCLCRISDEEKLMLCKLFANFSARHPSNLYNNSQNNILASWFTLGESDETIDRRFIQNCIAFAEGEMIEVLDGGDDKIENDVSLGSFANKLSNCTIQILVSNKSNIVFCDSLIQQVSYANEFYFPICPTMLAVFSCEQKGIDKGVRKIQQSEYERFVQLYLRDSHVHYIYANNRDTLEKLRRAI